MSPSVTRRRFVQSAGLSLLLRPALFGAVRQTAANERIGVAVIGLGGQGMRNLVNFLRHDDVEIITACDVQKARRDEAVAKVAEAKGGKACPAYRDFREVLARPDVDAVVISIGERWHAPMSILAAKAGKDIYCEKPASLGIREGRKLVDAVAAAKRVYQCGTQRRSQWAFHHGIELARSGRLGKLQTLYCHSLGYGWRPSEPPEAPAPDPESIDWDLWLGPSPARPFQPALLADWRRTKGLSDAGISEWGAHGMDLCQAAAGRDDTGPTRIFVEESHATATYADGLKIRFGQPPGYHPDSAIAMRLDGEDAWFYTDDAGNLDASHEGIIKDYRAERTRRWDDVRNWTDHQRNFLDCVRTRDTPASSAECAHRAATTCHLVSLCHDLGGEITWDPGQETITNRPELNARLTRTYRSPWDKS